MFGRAILFVFFSALRKDLMYEIHVPIIVLVSGMTPQDKNYCFSRKLSTVLGT